MKEIILPASNVIGIMTRASNSDMQSISALWGRFYSENIISKIPNKIDNEAIALYTDYESDHTKPYNLLIGCRVSSADSIPEGMAAKKIPAGKYIIFTAKGKMPDMIVDTWKEVWNSAIERKYAGDFEVYGPKSADPGNAEVDIYIGVKDQ